MSIEKISPESQLQEILESYEHLFGNLNDQEWDKKISNIGCENSLIRENCTFNQETKEVMHSSENELSFKNDKTDALQIIENLSGNFQTSDDFIDELIDCIRKINEGKEKLFKTRTHS